MPKQPLTCCSSGCALATRPRQVITTTPRPISLFKRLIADPATALTRAGTVTNAFNLAPAFLETIVARYGGTRLGRQELDGEMIEERADALWSRALIEACRVAAAPPRARASWWRSIRRQARREIPRPAGWWRRASLAMSFTCSRTRPWRGYRLPAGRAGDRAVAPARGRLARGGGQPGRRHGACRDPRGGCERAGYAGAGASRQVAARRADCHALRTGPGEARGRVSRAGRRDVRLRAGRAIRRPLARPARCAGVGGHARSPTARRRSRA